MEVQYKHKLADFEVVATHIPKDPDYYKSANWKSVPGYEVFKLYKFWFWSKRRRPYAPEIRRKSLEEVAEWLSVEVGLTEAYILNKLETGGA